ncbi:MAG: hypothetical protein JXO72_12705 [Vicinamibacteria bacterium]|nr:hypothetical protein [Vicinamibacteria bacterium]
MAGNSAEDTLQAEAKRKHELLLTLGVFLIYCAVTVAMTWPVAKAPARLAIPNGDLLSHAWAVAWVVHQTFTNPVLVFDANIYWPYDLSLAHGESLFAQSALAAPLLLLGGNPILAYNFLLLMSFGIGGLGMYLLARGLSGSRSAAFLAGLVYAFCAYKWKHLVHLGPASTQWFPFVILFFLRSAHHATLRRVAALSLFIALQTLSSGYYAVLMAALLGTLLLVDAPRLWRRATWRPIAAMLALTAAFTLLTGWPYRVLQERHGITRSRETCVYWSAKPVSFLYPGDYVGRCSLPHLRWLRGWTGRSAEPLFPGLLTILLSVVAILASRRREAVRLALAVGVVSFMLSLGPEIRLGSVAIPGPFDWLRHVPPINMMRVPSRIGVLVILAFAILAALGWARIMRSRSRTIQGLAVVLAGAFIVYEGFPFGLSRSFRPIPPPPPYTQWLAQAPRGSVLELPYESSPFFMVWSTAHWQPLVNGWGAFPAPLAESLGGEGQGFPRPAFTRRIQKAGVRYVIAHMDRLGKRRRRRVIETPLPPFVRLVDRFGPAYVYELSSFDDKHAPTAAR